MSFRRIVLVAASFALAVVLIGILIEVGKVDPRATLRQLQGVSLSSFGRLVLLNCLLVYISSEKWRSIDAAWRRSSETVPSRTASFAITSAGLAVGVFLPVQLAMSTTRTLGTFGHGRSLKRGTAGTLLEQLFDIIMVCFLAVASGITRIWGGGGMVWMVSAAAATGLAVLAVEPMVRVIRWAAGTCHARFGTSENTFLRGFGELRQSGLLDARLGRRLLMLSAVRFGVTVLMSLQTAAAVGLHIGAWQMAASIPFVALASVIALTPGGLGVNELTSVTALKMFGTPLAVATQWALANRVLVSVSYLFVATCAASVVGAQSIKGSPARNAVQGS